MSATISDAIAAVRRARTAHSETLPPLGPERKLWQAERELYDALEKLLLERLNLRAVVRS